jgi:hypothetical protein
MPDHKTGLRTRLLGLTVAIAATIPTPSYAGAIEDAFTNGKASVNARYRYETVDDSTNQDATASTLRTRVGFTTSKKKDLSMHVDFEHLTRVGDAEYNSTANGQTQYAKVVDPDVIELNQAFLKYKIIDDSDITVGRQRIIFDNARFVGNVGWRQNEQTFDAVRITGQPIKDLSINFVNVQRVKTIKGGNVDVSTNLLNVGYTAFPGRKLSGYAYLVEFDDTPANSTSTYGLRYKGATNNLLYTFEYASQSDYGDNPGSLSADYLFGELGYKIAKTAKVFVALESLGSDNGTAAFQTPLATKHAFNGWADKFLSTPNDGLEDMYVKVTGNAFGTKLVAVYHDFSAENGSIDYGTELDLVAVKKLNKTFKVLVKYADYDADTYSADTKKIWVALEMNLRQ